MAAGHASGAASRSQLPGWARTGLAGLGRTRVSGTLYRDRDTPLPSIRLTTDQHKTRNRDEQGRREEGERVAQLERNIVFLRQQHMETLQQLHSETEQLKRENRELSFRLIMCRCGHRCASSGSLRNSGYQPHPPRAKARTFTDELHVQFLQGEVEQLRQTLAEEKCKNRHILQVLQSRLQDSTSSPVAEWGEGRRTAGGGGSGPSHQECEAAIRLLQKEKEQKAHELSQIKADLRDILFCHKWSPDAYLQARAYVPHPLDTSTEGEGIQGGRRVFQRLRENMQLPPLKPHLPGDVAERQRRRQAVQKRPSRMGLPSLHHP